VEVVPTTIVGETCPVVACMFMMLIMLTTHIERVDLNLLLPLVALLEERHVSRAATRVGLSQPAMSRALQRLRRVLDDALLIRSTDGYRLTARANQIHAQLATIVPQLESLLATEAFNPREAPQSIHLAGTDYPASALGPAICREILAQSPHSTVRFHTWGDGIADQIKQGRVDLGFFGGYIPDDLSSTELLVEKFVCVVAKDHPLADKPAITLADYLQCKHVIIDVADGHQTDIDKPLQKLGTPRQLGLTVPYHAAAPLLLPGTTLMATLPSRLVAPCVDTNILRVLPAPREIKSMRYRMTWHPGLDNDSRHRWLRELVRSAIAKQPVPV
jgi:DNA-binding transcriptional LysR family regulator